MLSCEPPASRRPSSRASELGGGAVSTPTPRGGWQGCPAVWESGVPDLAREAALLPLAASPQSGPPTSRCPHGSPRPRCHDGRPPVLCSLSLCPGHLAASLPAASTRVSAESAG